MALYLGIFLAFLMTLLKAAKASNDLKKHVFSGEFNARFKYIYKWFQRAENKWKNGIVKYLENILSRWWWNYVALKIFLPRGGVEWLLFVKYNIYDTKSRAQTHWPTSEKIQNRALLCRAAAELIYVSRWQNHTTETRVKGCVPQREENCVLKISLVILPRGFWISLGKRNPQFH